MATKVRTSTQVLPAEFTLTTTGNVDDLDFSNADLIRFNNASLATLRGLKAGTAGQRVTIVSIGAGQVNLAHQDAGSTAVNRLVNLVTGGITPLAAGAGSATYQYDGTTARWRLVAHNQGALIAIAYASGNFTATGAMTWTVDVGDQLALSYMVIQDTVLFLFDIENSSIGGTPSNVLQIAIPNSYSARTRSSRAALQFLDNGVLAPAFANVNLSGTVVRIFRGDGANLTASTDNTAAIGTLIFEVT